jgi:hypothetical protein
MAAFPPEYWFSPHPMSDADATGAATFLSPGRLAYHSAASTYAGSSICSSPVSDAGCVPE